VPGWIKLPRDIVKHSIWQKEEPFCWKAAFIDLMLLANFEAHPYFFNEQEFLVNPGEIITSQEKLALRWKWSRGRVYRFLEKLKDIGEIDYQADMVSTRITLSKWKTYQLGELTDERQVRQVADRRQTAGRQVADTYNNDKNEKNDKKESQVKNLKFVRAKKTYEELTEAERELALECAKFYEQRLKSKIDFNKLCILIYGSEEDKEEHGFGDWQTLRRALGCLSKEELTHKVLHPYYYIWSLSRQKEYVEKIKKSLEG